MSCCRIISLYLLLLFLGNEKIYAGSFPIHTESENNYVEGKYIEIMESTDSVILLEQAIDNPAWIPVTSSKYLILPKANTYYWLRLKIINTSSEDGDWILEFPDIHNSDLKLFDISESEKVTEYNEVGFDHNFDRRRYKHKNYFFKIKLSGGKESTFYIRLKSRYSSSFAMYIRSIEYLFSYSLREYYFLGIFYGILFIMMLYNLFIFLITREKVYIFYVFYVVAGMIYTFSEDGTGFQFLWPSLPYLNHILFAASPFLLMASFSLYAVEFLELRKRPLFPLKYLFIYLITYCFIILLPFALPGFVKAIVFIAPFVFIYIYSVKLYRTGYKAARFFIAGFSVILLSFLLYLLRILEWTPSNLYTLYVFNFGMVLEVMILSYSLGDKMRLLKADKEKAQQKIIEQLQENEKLKDKVNRELEEKVQQRTAELFHKSQELENSNHKLEELSRKLDQLNSQLDIDNWNLKKMVKEETKSRILSEKVSFEEFLKIYPNGHSCLQYLSELKWKDGFNCKKCSNSSFSRGEKPLSRKCNRCKYTESATSGTLFHGIKFSLQKAFYIVYDTYNESNRSTIDQLSETIDLRRVTVWAFRKKVQESKPIKSKDQSGWESLIFQE